MAEYIVELDSKHSIALKLAFAEEMRGGDFIRGEIVRCRDCRHMHTVRNWLGMDVDECWLHADPESGALGKERTESNGFCAWGERKKVDA